ncbi:MAG: M56 family metallopeptidase, partial [Pseudomonadales bacterium]|nr:M56 family metallopeptidase [Pseudomonadales bacterium]
MTLAVILLNYFKLGLLVMASYVVWDTATFVQSRFNKGTKANFQLRMARIVFLSPLLMPLIVVLLSVQSPTSELIPIENLQIKSEPMGFAIVITVALLLMVGIVINVYRFAKEFIKLKAIIRESTNLKKLGKVQIVYNPNIKIPFATGLLRTKTIVLPEELILARENLQLVLKHEGHHIRRGDLYWSVFARLVSIVFFWNPAAHAWKRDLHDLQEFACDEYVTSHEGVSRKAYARCLFHVAAYESY